MEESVQADNLEDNRNNKQAMGIFLLCLLINAAVFWLFNISSVIKTGAYILMAAGIPVLGWIVVFQKALGVVVTRNGITLSEIVGRDRRRINEIGKNEIESILVVRDAKEIFWCRILPKSGKGIMLGNFQERSAGLIEALTRFFPEKVKPVPLDDGEKRAKKICDRFNI